MPRAPRASDVPVTDAVRSSCHEAPGDVVVLHVGSARADHDHLTCAAIARTLATLKGYRFAGDFDAHASYPGHLYFVPTDTLVGMERSRALGIVGDEDFFGGVVPFPFVATKCISHPLVDASAHAPQGWSETFARDVRDAVLEGYSAFDADDAMRAGLRLLARGSVRLKHARGVGGQGQTSVGDRYALERALADLPGDELRSHGVALEQDLSDVTTHSAGQARVDDLLVSYWGTQRVTTNNRGETAYGGSDLLVARGNFAALLSLDLPHRARDAVEKARRYDAAAFRSFAGLVASRRNYDVAEGSDASGIRRSGVLEQSWRVGGASGAEVSALAAFRDCASLTSVRARSVESYGRDATPPPGATVYFRGVDDCGGPLTKYALLDCNGNA